MKGAPGSRGFTLVEVLVAMVVLAIMAVMAWQGVDGIVRARTASQARLEQTLRLNTVMAQWEQDLASIQNSGAVPAITCDGATVRLTRHTPAGLQIVAWALRTDGGVSSWWRWAGPAVTTTNALEDSWLSSQQLQGGEPGQLRTLTGLTQWQVYFYRGNGWANCQSTGDVAPPLDGGNSPNNGQVRVETPNGVRVVLTFAPDSGLAGNLTRDILLGP